MGRIHMLTLCSRWLGRRGSPCDVCPLNERILGFVIQRLADSNSLVLLSDSDEL